MQHTTIKTLKKQEKDELQGSSKQKNQPHRPVMDRYNVQNGRWRETEQEITTIKRIIYTKDKKRKKEYKGGKSQASPPHQTKNQKRRKLKLILQQKTKSKKLKKWNVYFLTNNTNQET